MKSREITLPAGKFKARCLELMDEVNRDQIEIVITKDGRSVARVVPAASRLFYGAMSGMATVSGDLDEPSGETWDAESPL